MSSWLGGWFGGGAAKKSQASKEAIIGLRRQLDMLRKREAHVEKQIADEDANARRYINTNKAGMWNLFPLGDILANGEGLQLPERR
jgi:charged multivesicular body protein 4